MQLFYNIDKDAGSAAVFLEPVSHNGLFTCCQQYLEEVGIFLTQSIQNVSEVGRCECCAGNET